MAFELCTGGAGGDPSLGQIISPRISFSHDIPQTGFVPVEQYVRSSSSTSSMDFDFCVFRQSFDLQQDNSSSSADELFLNGKILPIEIKRRIGPAPTTPPPPAILIPPAPVTKPAGQKQQGSSSKAAVFWKIKRSSSLNCGSGYARTLCPLPLLSRSNSTGSSSPIPKRTLYSSSSRSSRDAFNPIPQNNNKSSSTKQKPPLMKSQQASSSNSRNNGVRITSVLNVSASSLFGMGSMFSHGNGRDKNKKKK
ncbi:unnamed protein product [Cuscuta campestris]|uniref:Uncharacterized protein n=1 Tax=Cuscuta campestris TaxID=132261 RepID=A0A484M124_9ASTE|nr:unnamed protein product [Cuscuta campestris]